MKQPSYDVDLKMCVHPEDILVIAMTHDTDKSSLKELCESSLKVVNNLGAYITNFIDEQIKN